MIRTTLALIPLLLLSACDNEPGKGKTQATVAAPVTATAAATTTGASAAKSQSFAFSNDGSKVEYTGAKVTGKHPGGFGKFSGTVSIVDNAIEKSTVSVDIDTDSLTSDNDKLTGHLKSPDFFDVAKFPKARFSSTAIKAGGEAGATHTVTGNLDLHGVTKSITFPATIRITADGVEVDADFVINRKDFGIVYPGMPDDLIKDDVAIKLAIRGKKAG